MAKIHGIVYIIIGFFVSIISWRLDYDKLISFFYAGLVFILVGVVKLIFNFLTKEKKHVGKTHRAVHHAQRHKYCRNCRNVLRAHDRFCSKCGARA